MFRLFRRNKPQQKKSIAEAYFYNLDLSAGIGSTYKAYATEGYAKNYAARQAVQLVAKSAASVPLLLYKEMRDGDDEEIHQHELLDKLKRPNHSQVWLEFMEELASYYKLDGQTFVRITANNKNFELFNLRPDRVTVNKSLTGWLEIISYSYIDDNGRNYTFPPEEIIHFKNFNPLDEYEGLSEFSSISIEIDQKNLAGTWNVSILKNGGRPSFAVLSKTNLTDQQFKNAQDTIREQYSGAYNAGHIALFEGNEVEIKELSFGAEELSFIDGQKLASIGIGVALGVAPELIGITDAKKYDNAQAAKTALYTETVLPFLNYVLSEFSERLCPRYGRDLYLAPWTDKIDVLQADRKLEAERIDVLTNSSVITYGQAANDLGYEIRPDMADRYAWEVEYKLKWQLWPEETAQPQQDTTVKAWLYHANNYLAKAENKPEAFKVVLYSLLSEYGAKPEAIKKALVLPPKNVLEYSDIENVKALMN